MRDDNGNENGNMIFVFSSKIQVRAEFRDWRIAGSSYIIDRKC